MFQIKSLPFSFFTSFFSAVLSGVLISMGFPGDTFPCLGVGWVQPIAFVPLFIALWQVCEQNRVFFLNHRISKSGVLLRAFFLVWVTGFVCTAFAFFWTTKPMVHFGGLSQLSSYCIFLLYCLFAGFYWCVLLFPYHFFNT